MCDKYEPEPTGVNTVILLSGVKYRVPCTVIKGVRLSHNPPFASPHSDCQLVPLILRLNFLSFCFCSVYIYYGSASLLPIWRAEATVGTEQGHRTGVEDAEEARQE